MTESAGSIECRYLSRKCSNPQILCVARRISLGLCLAMVLLEVPEGRHKVAHRGSGGEAHKQVPKPRRGGTRSQDCAAPTGLDALPKPSPTTSVVGYVVSSLRDWAGGCSRPAVTTGKNSGLATTVGFGCGSAALRLEHFRFKCLHTTSYYFETRLKIFSAAFGNN